jgi:S-adenosylmethionine:tRNA ribosyltransferase-isomerase
MKPARWPRPNPLDERLLAIDPCAGAFTDARIADLGAFVRPGDLLVVNDAATLPASLRGVASSGRPVEVRLLSERTDGLWSAVLFGEGDWRLPTEDRPAPERLAAGDRIVFALGFTATVERLSSLSSRLLELRFDPRGEGFWKELYRHGRPVQYSYLDAQVELWHVQTHYAARPWAAEPPSAGRPLSWALLLTLVRRGARIATLTHAAGLSSTGDPALDAALPLAERFEIPSATVEAIEETRRRAGRVIAVGTTVARALEGSAVLHGGFPAPGPGETELRIDGSFELRVVDGLLTGLHEPASSHFRLLEAFAPRRILEASYAYAERAGYLLHEFGDSSLILCA